MLDDALGPTVPVRSGGTHHCATIDSDVGYLAPAHPGSFTGIGHIVRMGRTVAFPDGKLFHADGQCVARAAASARIVPTAAIPRA